MYVNDLVIELQTLDRGIRINDRTVSCLLYADDMVLLAENADDLQSMMTVVNEWCQSWSMKINAGKTKIVQFRNASVNRCITDFHFGDQVIEMAEQYKYLGLIFTEHLDWTTMAKHVADTANRALGLIITKFKACGNMPFDVFTKLYESLVLSVVNYGSSVWGSKTFTCINNVHNRACRFFLGVGRQTPNSAVQGDMGWKMIYHHVWINDIKLMYRTSSMPETRLSKHVYEWARMLSFDKKNSLYRVDEMLIKLDVMFDVEHLTDYNLNAVLSDLESKLMEFELKQWSDDVHRVNAVRGTGKNKLRTYRLFKQTFVSEQYVKCKYMSRKHRSAMARFRCGVAPLRIETGRYERTRLPPDQRICPLCKNGVEDERHVLLYCPFYTDLRNDLFLSLSVGTSFNMMSDDEKFIYIFSNTNCLIVTARTLYEILERRKILLSI